MKNRPPRICEFFLELILPARDADVIVGDLHEEFAQKTKSLGYTRSTFWYCGEMVRSSWPSLRRKLAPSNIRRAIMQEWPSEIRFAVRGIRKDGLTSAAAIFALTLGIAATTAIFTVADRVVISPLPYPDSDRLAIVWNDWSGDGAGRGSQSIPELMDLRERSTTIVNAAGVQFFSTSIGAGQSRAIVQAIGASPSLFSMLGTVPALGTFFSPGHESGSEQQVVALSYSFWMSNFGGDPDVVGREVLLDSATATVVGVLPKDFLVPVNFGFKPDIYTPTITHGGRTPPRSVHGLRTVIRTAEGVSPRALAADLGQISSQIKELYPSEYNETFSFRATPLKQVLFGDLRTPALLLTGMASLVLLVACANVANLLMVKATGRERELAVRAALGASRSRLLRQQLIENLALALCGGLLGIFVAAGSLDLMLALNSDLALRLGDASLSPRTVGFTSLAALGSALMFGLGPALNSTRSATQAARLRQGARGRARSRWHEPIIALQVAIALVMMIGAGLLTRSYQSLNSVEIGITVDQTVAVKVNLAGWDTPQARDLYSTVVNRTRNLPRVMGVGTVNNIPIGDHASDWPHDIIGTEENFSADFMTVSPGYFEAIGAHIVAGRDFTEDDTEGVEPVVVVNEQIALAWPGGNPVGAQIAPMTREGETQKPVTIVGVVSNIRTTGLETEIEPQIYYPNTQLTLGLFSPKNMWIVARTSGDPATVGAQIRNEVVQLAPNVASPEIVELSDIVSGSTALNRFALALVGSFALVGLLLTTVGISGVMAFVVRAERKEIGIRLALGAASGRVVSGVMSRSMRSVAVGSILGILVSLAATRLLANQLFEISPTDPISIALATALILSVATLTSWIPATRAARISPLETLQEE